MKIPSRLSGFKQLFFSVVVLSSASTSAQVLNSAQGLGETKESVTTSPSIEVLIEHDINQIAQQRLEEYAKKLKEKGYRSEIRLGNIDPLLAVKKCKEAPNFELIRPPEQHSHINATISCSAPTKWKLYLSAEFKIYGSAVASSRPIPRGVKLEPNDFEIVEHQINTNGKAYYPNTVDLIGMLSRRPIRQGMLITPSYIAAPKLIERGDQVTILARNEHISVRMQGTAMTHGKKGQQISIKNNKSRRIVKAYVEEKGLVSIRL